MSANAAKIVRGDFQTPLPLAQAVCETLMRRGVCPAVVVEPTCGTGAFLAAGISVWGGRPACFGFDVEAGYVAAARQSLHPGICVTERDFFQHDWCNFVRGLPPGRLLFLGNPPWVTSARQGVLGGANLPTKANIKSLTGIEAKTGKSNFDVSEWMMRELIAAGLAANRVFDVAMLCKTGTARKLLESAWRGNLPVTQAAMFRVDAAHWFGAAASACLLHITFDPAAGAKPYHAPCYPDLESVSPSQTLGYADGTLIADADAYAQTRHLGGRGSFRWRSGVKHDLARVMELRRGADGTLRNGFGDTVDIEPERVFPLLKCTDLFHGRTETDRHVLLTQSVTGENTEAIADTLPLTGAYLNRHRELFAARKSSIYRGQSAFALFGIGAYTFAPYKVAVSGLHNDVRFRLLVPVGGKPVVLDDTCYFVSFETQAEARQLLQCLETSAVRLAITAYLFPDAKRPVTADLLHRLPMEPNK